MYGKYELFILVDNAEEYHQSWLLLENPKFWTIGKVISNISNYSGCCDYWIFGCSSYRRGSPLCML